MSTCKTEQRTTTVSAAVADAVSELQFLGEEAREICDNMPESLQSTSRYESFDISASALESLDELETPESVSDLPCVYVEMVQRRKGRGVSRATRCSNAVLMLNAAIETISVHRDNLEKVRDELDLDKLHDGERDTADEVCFTIEELETEIQNIIDEADGLEWLSMFG